MLIGTYYTSQPGLPYFMPTKKGCALAPFSDQRAPHVASRNVSVTDLLLREVGARHPDGAQGDQQEDSREDNRTDVTEQVCLCRKHLTRAHADLLNVRDRVV